MTLHDLQQILFRHQDTAYGDFSAKLIPSVPREKIIGVRSPEYRKIIAQIGNDPVITILNCSVILLSLFWRIIKHEYFYAKRDSH